MKLKHLLCIGALITGNLMLNAQQYYNQTASFLNANKVWALAHNAGLDFSSGTAMPIRTTIPSVTLRQGEGTCSVADPHTGKLLFYSDGAQCWNASQQVMPNGDSLQGNGGRIWAQAKGSGVTTKQGSCIVPVIGDSSKYYLFSLNYQGEIDPSGSLFYNVVDMALDNGRGDIVAGRKNILLDSTHLSEAMIAIPGNNCDVWLLVHSYAPMDTFTEYYNYKAYHITQAGIDPVPVISKGTITNWVGSLSVSPDRKKIGMAGFQFQVPLLGYDWGGTEVADFDPNSGMVSNAIRLPVASIGSGGCAFSPDNTKFYCDEWTTNVGSQLLQFDVSILDSVAIAGSKEILSPLSWMGGSGLRLYNDTIYVAGFGTAAIGTINEPNKKGSACDYQGAAISLLQNTNSAMGCLPTEVVYALPPDTLYRTALDTFLCGDRTENILLQPLQLLPGYQYVWSDNSTDTLRRTTENGRHWVQYTNGCHSYVDSFIIAGSYLPVPVITIDLDELGTSLSYNTYQWMLNGQPIPGATDSIYTVLENGDYQVIVGNASGCVDTSALYKVSNVSIGGPAGLSKQRVSIYPNPAQQMVFIRYASPVSVQVVAADGRVLKTVTDAKSLDIGDLAEGVYSLRIADNRGQLLETVKLTKVR